MRKWMLDAFHKVDERVEGPIPVEESVAAQIETILNLTAEDSGKVLGHRGDTEWF